MRRSAPLVLSAALFAPLMAWSHAELTDPTPRSACVNATNCKTAPCGTIAAGNVTKTFFIGSSYDISWNETINHVGRYRLGLSTNGEVAFDTFVVMNYGTVLDQVGPASYNWSWTVPDTANCDPCVMQLIQGMYDDMNGTFVDYFNCADIQILPAGSATPTPTPGPTATPTPGGNPNDPVEVDGYGSCSVASGVAASALGATLFGLALLIGSVLVRRRA